MSAHKMLAALIVAAATVAFGVVSTPGRASTLERHASGHSCEKCFWEEIDRQGVQSPA